MISVNLSNRIHYLDGLRGIFSLAVAASHILGSVYGYGNERPLVGAYLAVDYFFILSGYVLYRIATYGGDRITVLFVKRLLRLWPLHALMTIVSFLIISANQFENLYVPHGIQLSVSEFLRNITFVIGTGLSHAKLLNEPSWSISVEFWLSACLLYFLFRLPSFAIIFVSVLCYIIVFSFGRGTMTAHDTFFYLSTGMYRGVAGMAVGGLMYRHSQWFQKLTASIAARWCDLALSVFFFIILIGIYMGAGSLWDAALILAFTPFLVVRFVDRAEWIKGFLSSPILIWLGQISVSVYLVHTPLIIFLFPRGIVHGYSLPFIGIITLITTLVLSTISYRFFELPVQRIASIIVRRFQHVVGSRMVKL